MEKESDSPANLFRELGREWTKHRDDKQAIADLHASTEAFKTLLEVEKGLVHRCALILHYIEKELETMQAMDRADKTDYMHPWISPQKLLLARQRSCERSVSLCKQGRIFMCGWRDHFAKVIPEMAHRFPHTYTLETFFESLEHAFLKKHEEFTDGRSFLQYPSIEKGKDALGNIELLIQDILNRLHIVQHDLAVLEHDRESKPLQELIFEELQKLAPLVFVTHASVKNLA